MVTWHARVRRIVIADRFEGRLALSPQLEVPKTGKDINDRFSVNTRYGCAPVVLNADQEVADRGLDSICLLLVQLGPSFRVRSQAHNTRFKTEDRAKVIL